MWHIGERARSNTIEIWFTNKSFVQSRNIIENLLKELIVSFNSFYGYISDFKIEESQHVTGTIETRMPGIFWCNFFGKVYVDFFGKDKMLSAPWYKTEELDQNGIITYLTEEPDNRELIESPELENKFKILLGKDSFGNLDEWKNSNYQTQYKSVPKLDFSEIRKPLSSFNIT
jgi:hypothetical protein